MAYEWHRFYGGYSRSGTTITNRLICGSPADTFLINNATDTSTPVQLAQAHAAGVGKGIGFEANGYDVSYQIDGVMASVYDSGVWNPNSGYYVQNSSGYYDWYLTITTSTDGGSTFPNTLFSGLIFSHPWQSVSIYSTIGNGWLADAQTKCQYSGMFTLNSSVTHIKFELTGANVFSPDSIIFPIEEIIQDFRPGAQRTSGEWLSLDRTNGMARIRLSNTYTDIPKINYSDAGVANRGSCRIRINGVWVAQSQIGLND